MHNSYPFTRKMAAYGEKGGGIFTNIVGVAIICYCKTNHLPHQLKIFENSYTRPRSTFGNMSDYRLASSILAQSNTFVEIDREIVSTVILLSSADSFKKGCCQLQHEVLVNHLFKLAQEKSMIR